MLVAVLTASVRKLRLAFVAKAMLVVLVGLAVLASCFGPNF
jgi:hypothetical protein